MGARASRLVGRASELATLDALADEASAGRRRLGLVEAGPGLGKTALVEAFAARATARGARVVWGRSWETGGAPPFWPWTQVLRSLQGDPEDGRLTEAMAALERGDAGEGLSETARFVLFDEVSAALGSVARASRPLVVVLEDVHAADVPSVLLTEFVARHEDGGASAVVATMRPGTAAARPDLTTAIGRLRRCSGCRIDLGALSNDEVAEVVEMHSPGRQPESSVAEVVARSEGHPFFAIELARSLGRGERGLPATIRDAVLGHVDTLAPADVEILQLAATVGRDVALTLLDQLATSPAGRAVDAAASEGLMTVADGVASFSHALVRDVLYDALDEERRSELHEAVARAVELLHGDDLDTHLTELAHHYLLAPEAVRRNKGLVNAIAAGARARRLLAYEEAAELYERALHVARAAGATPAERCELLVAVGEARMRAGHTPEGRRALADAFELASGLASFPLMARAAEWFAGVVVAGGLVDEDAVRLLERALERAPDTDSEEKALVLGRLAHELSMSEEPHRAEALAREAIAVARRCGSARTLAETIAWGFPALATPGLMEEALPIVTELVDLAVGLRDVDLEVRGRAFRSNLLLETGRLVELHVEMQTLRSLAERVPVPFLRWAADVTPFLATVGGDLGEVTDAADRALAVAPEVPDAMSTWIVANIAVAWERGTLADLEPVITAAGEGRPTARRLMRAIVVAGQAQAGRREEARAELRGLVRDIAGPGVFTLETLHWLAEAACILEDRPSAEALYESLLPFRERHLAMRILRPVAYWGTSSRHLGNLAAVAGRTGDAIAHLRRALELHATVGARIYVAHTQAELSALLDGDEAAQLAREAARTAEELELTWLRARIVGGAREDHDTGLRVSLVREGEFWTLESGDRVARLRDSKGLGQLARLLSRPGVEVHSLELDGGTDLAGGDLGPMLDATAKEAYRRRIGALREALDEAEELGDTGRADLTRVELDAITDELSRSIGLGGRDRSTGSAAEQARINVTKLVKSTIRRIGESRPDLERHLRATIRTGVYCCYDPTAAERPIVWDVGGP